MYSIALTCVDFRACSNTRDCACPWVDCKNINGHCCDCVAQHRDSGSLPSETGAVLQQQRGGVQALRRAAVFLRISVRIFVPH